MTYRLEPLQNPQQDLNYLYHLSKVERFKLRVDSCKYLEWININCKTCEHQLTKRPFKLSCLSPYCNELPCIENRKRCIEFRLKEFGIRSKHLYNFVIGFKPLKTITKKDRIARQKAFRYFMDQLNNSYEKEYGKKLYSICARDLNISKNNSLRLHYHVATLPVKDFRNFTEMIKRSTEKTYNKFNIEIAPSFSGYKKTSSTLSYFAKRVSGLFGHNRNEEQAFTYKDIMSIEDYFNVFYKTKALNFFNLKYRTRVACSEFISMLNVIPKNCDNCGVPTKDNTYFETYNPKRPPDLIKNKDLIVFETIPVIRNSRKHICNDCDHKFYYQDYNFQKNICKLCNVRNTSFAYRKTHELEFKLPEVAKMWKKESDRELQNEM